MGSPKLTINDRPVALFGMVPTANGAIESACEFTWEVCFGVESPVVTWELEPALAEFVLTQKEVTIHAEGFNVQAMDIKRVVVIGKTASHNKRRVAVQFGDIRRYTKYTNPILALNVRAKTGNNSLNGFGANGQFIQAIPVFKYRLYSVNSDGTPVVAAQVVKQVMDACVQASSDWVLDGPPRATLIPNDLLLFDRGDVTMQRMLGTIGGLDVYVNPNDGLIHVKNRVLGDEKAEIEKRIDPSGKTDVEGGGKIVWRVEDHNRPSAFDIVCDPWLEFRSDFAEDAGTQSAPDKDDFWCENVAEVMEFRKGNYLAKTPDGTQQCLPGEYLAFGQYLSTMPNGPLVSSLSYSLLQAGFNNSNLIYGILGNGQIPDPGEEARVKSAIQCYRQVFRINPRITSRARPGTIQAVMVSVADAETGRWKPSDVYVEHCVIPTLEVAIGNSTNALQAWNRDSFPPLDSTPNGTEKIYGDSGGMSPSPLNSMRVAPFQAEMIDSDAGLFMIEARPDYNDERQTVVPSRITDIPTLDYTTANNGLALYFWDQAAVAQNHRMTVILSMIPGVGEYHTPVSIADAAKRLQIDNVKAGSAPVMSIRIGQDLLTARFAWDDTKRQDFKNAIQGNLVGTNDDPLKTLVPVNKSDIVDYGTGLSAAILAQYVDHYEGVQTLKTLDPTVLPVGSLHGIVHKIGAKGRCSTTLNCSQTRDPFIADHFLSASTLATLRGRVTT